MTMPSITPNVTEGKTADEIGDLVGQIEVHIGFLAMEEEGIFPEGSPDLDRLQRALIQARDLQATLQQVGM